MKKLYEVCLEYTVRTRSEVEADSEEEAVEIATVRIGEDPLDWTLDYFEVDRLDE